MSVSIMLEMYLVLNDHNWGFDKLQTENGNKSFDKLTHAPKSWYVMDAINYTQISFINLNPIFYHYFKIIYKKNV